MPRDERFLVLSRPNVDKKEFTFDSVLDMGSSQDQSYESLAMPVLTDVLNGFNGVIMAYGQTGSGKTHTIFGASPSKQLNMGSGIVPRAVYHIFDFIKRSPNKQFKITVSFLEIYME